MMQLMVSFIIAVEVVERFAYYGIASNLITYLTGPLGQSTAAAAAAQVNAWAGASSLLPLLGAFVADTFLGQYRTIILASLVYILGLGLLTLLATLPSVNHIWWVQTLPSSFRRQTNSMHRTPSSAKPRVHSLIENLSWVLGFAIPGIVMAVGLLVFLLGTTYRFSVKRDEVSPFAGIGRVFVSASRKRKEDIMEQGEACSIREIEESKAVLRLVSIWTTSLIHAVVLAQSSTLFTKQGATMDRSITTGLKIPAATLQCFIRISVLLLIPIYDRIFVPLARSITGKPAGITMLQRIRTGIVVCYSNGDCCFGRDEEAENCLGTWVGRQATRDDSNECVVAGPSILTLWIICCVCLRWTSSFFTIRCRMN
ncbi:Detected protein of unknown function [Hibiscus syriacus]|uniref:Uncharacterized protein n=1 Tax=Hibiscus syriacus TaxID=106335 RepID=A0A6A3CVW7_HIBSY|nr:Detected protein of unknown function [Hibiscus syriacus]